MYRNEVGVRDDRLCVVKYIRPRRRRRYPDRKKTSKESTRSRTRNAEGCTGKTWKNVISVQPQCFTPRGTL